MELFRVFIYASGNAFTIPVGRYIIQGNIVNQYGKVNEFRMPPYHRLDLSLNRKIIVRQKYMSELNISVYNIYNRVNPYFCIFKQRANWKPIRLISKPYK